MLSSSSEAHVGGCHLHAPRPPGKAKLPGLCTLAGNLPSHPQKRGRHYGWNRQTDTEENHTFACCEILASPQVLPGVATKQPGLGIGPARCAKIHRKSLAALNFAKLTKMRATPNLRVERLPATLQMIAWKQAAFPKKYENRRWISSWPHFEAAVQLNCFGLLKIISKEVHFRERACLPST